MSRHMKETNEILQEINERLERMEKSLPANRAAVKATPPTTEWVEPPTPPPSRYLKECGCKSTCLFCRFFSDPLLGKNKS